METPSSLLSLCESNRHSGVFYRVATRQGNVREKNIFSRSGNCQGIWNNVREILKRGKCQGNVREFHVRVFKSILCIFIHKIAWFLNYKLNFLSFWHITLFPVVLISSKKSWVLSFCLKILRKSRNSCSEMFYVVYFFEHVEARITTLLLYILSSDFLTSVFWLKCFCFFNFYLHCSHHHMSIHPRHPGWLIVA